MAYYSEDLVEEVRSRNDIVDVISGYVRLQKKGSTYFGLCPFHNEKTSSFSVSPHKQMYYCFGCGAGGSVFNFLMEYENFSYPEAIESLAARAGIALPKQERSAKEKKEASKKAQLLEVNKEAAGYFYRLLRSAPGKHALEYFQKRELSEETMRRFGLGYANKYSDDLYRFLRKKGYSDALLKDSGLISIDEKRGGHDKFWNRAMFPIMDANSRVIGFGGRVMGDGEPKYLNSPETFVFDKSRNLYGLNFARSSRKRGILLCEGYMDVIALHQAGFDNAVASLGTAFTSGHANLLKRYTKEVYLTFDSDNAGVRAALRALPILKEVGISAKIIHMQPYKDPDEFIKALGAEAFQKRIEEAENSFLFEVSVMEREFDLRDPESKTAFFRKVSGRLAEFQEPLERENYMEAICRKYSIRYEQLRSMVNTAGAKGGLAAEPVRRPLKSGIHEKNKKEDGMKMAQRLLLTWLIEDATLFERIRPHVSPEDFTEELYQQVAGILFEQFEKGEVHPARILDMFPEEEQQREVAALFHAKLSGINSPGDREKALQDVVHRVKKNSIDYRAKQADPSDMVALQKIIEERRKLTQLKV